MSFCCPQTRPMTSWVSSNVRWQRTQYTSTGRNRKPRMVWSSCTRSTTRDWVTLRWTHTLTHPHAHLSRLYCLSLCNNLNLGWQSSLQVHTNANDAYRERFLYSAFSLKIIAVAFNGKQFGRNKLSILKLTMQHRWLKAMLIIWSVGPTNVIWLITLMEKHFKQCTMF